MQRSMMMISGIVLVIPTRRSRPNVAIAIAGIPLLSLSHPVLRLGLIPSGMSIGTHAYRTSTAARTAKELLLLTLLLAMSVVLPAALLRSHVVIITASLLRRLLLLSRHVLRLGVIFSGRSINAGAASVAVSIFLVLILILIVMSIG